MLYWALCFLVLAASIAGVLGFGGVAAAASAGIAKVLFVVFLVAAGDQRDRRTSRPRRRVLSTTRDSRGAGRAAAWQRLRPAHSSFF